MDKVTEFLERYVQWVALAIAVLFLGYAVYSYMPGLNQPVTVEVQNAPYGPGEADTQIQNLVAKPLDDAMNAQHTLSMPVPAYSTQIHEQLTKPTTAPALPAVAMAFRPVELPNVDFTPRTAVTTGQDVTKVRALPTLPAAILSPDPTTGFAMVDPTQAGAGGAPVGGGGAPVGGPPVGGGQIGGRPDAPPGATGAPPGPAALRPTAPAGAQVVAAGGAAGPTKDVTWVRVPFTIPMGQLLAAFRAVNLPPDWSKTTILKVDLVREKELADGNWGPEEVVATLPTVQLQPMPPEGSGRDQLQSFVTWAGTNAGQILQPPFFHVLAGDDPTLEHVAAVPEVDTTTFRPENYPLGANLKTLTPDQLRQVLAWRKQQEDERRRAAAAATPTRAPAAIPRGARGAGAAGGGTTGGTRATPRPQPQPQPRPQPEPILPPDMTGGTTPAPFQAPPAGPPIQLAALPTEPLSPAEATDIQGVAYDITGTSEASYRYRIRYTAENPVFASVNVVDPASLAQTFALVGEDKNTWTTPVTIAPLTHVFVAQPLRAGSTVRFNVYRWEAGHWQASTATAGSGDPIGKVENGTDFRTPWTVVEVRSDSSSAQPYVLLMDADGTLKKQEYETDTNSPLQQQLKAQIAPAAGQPGAPGVNPGGPGVPGAGGATGGPIPPGGGPVRPDAPVGGAPANGANRPPRGGAAGAAG